MSQTTDVKRKILEANEQEASRLRSGYLVAGTLVANLISSPGSGKTTLLEASARELKDRYSVGVVVGDIATERDAERLREMGIPARQILTGGACHLDARMVGQSVDEAGFPKLDFLFIENVGNLICPTSYDLGEDFKIALLSVTEGDDKPFKYPGIFSNADVAVVTKADLLPHVSFDLEAVRRQVKTLRPDGSFLTLSVRSGEGMKGWFDLLESRLTSKRAGR